MHVTCRCAKGVGRLRTGEVRQAIARAIAHVNQRKEFRVVHVSVQHDHLHFLVEADDHQTFVSGMRALTITVAKAINAAKQRTGRVFGYRYHATTIESPRQARNALAYVLNNWRHHLEDEKSLASRSALIDPYASGGSLHRLARTRGVRPTDAYAARPRAPGCSRRAGPSIRSSRSTRRQPSDPIPKPKLSEKRSAGAWRAGL